MKEQLRGTTGEQSTGAVARRRFLKKSAGVAVAAPAVALLLSAQSKVASAQVAPYQPTDAFAPPGTF